MKKILFSCLSVFTMIGVFTIYSCQKENLIQEMHTSKQKSAVQYSKEETICSKWYFEWTVFGTQGYCEDFPAWICFHCSVFEPYDVGYELADFTLIYKDNDDKLTFEVYVPDDKLPIMLNEISDGYWELRNDKDTSVKSLKLPNILIDRFDLSYDEIPLGKYSAERVLNSNRIKVTFM